MYRRDRKACIDRLPIGHIVIAGKDTFIGQAKNRRALSLQYFEGSFSPQARQIIEVLSIISREVCSISSTCCRDYNTAIPQLIKVMKIVRGNISRKYCPVLTHIGRAIDRTALLPGNCQYISIVVQAKIDRTIRLNTSVGLLPGHTRIRTLIDMYGGCNKEYIVRKRDRMREVRVLRRCCCLYPSRILCAAVKQTKTCEQNMTGTICGDSI